MSATTDVTRQKPEVMASRIRCLNRSNDFWTFFVLMGFTYPDSRDQQLPEPGRSCGPRRARRLIYLSQGPGTPKQGADARGVETIR
jgi:hypothetical protein